MRKKEKERERARVQISSIVRQFVHPLFFTTNPHTNSAIHTHSLTHSPYIRVYSTSMGSNTRNVAFTRALYIHHNMQFPVHQHHFSRLCVTAPVALENNANRMFHIAAIFDWLLLIVAKSECHTQVLNVLFFVRRPSRSLISNMHRARTSEREEREENGRKFVEFASRISSTR